MELGFPVAIKLLSNAISHKAKSGGVKLGLESGDKVDKAVDEIIESAREATDIEIENFLVENMVVDARDEYIIGIKCQSALGLALMIGRGGTVVETMNIFATVLLPLIDADLLVAMECVGLDSAALGHNEMKQAIHAVAAYAIDHVDELESLDVNPVIVTANGEAIATDALIVNIDTG